MLLLLQIHCTVFKSEKNPVHLLVREPGIRRDTLSRALSQRNLRVAGNASVRKLAFPESQLLEVPCGLIHKLWRFDLLFELIESSVVGSPASFLLREEEAHSDRLVDTDAKRMLTEYLF